MFKDPEEVLTYFEDFFRTNQGPLGFKYIAVGDEKLLPEYPALQLISGPLTRDLVGGSTHQFAVLFVMDMWVYHANLTQTYRERTLEDMALATSVKDLLDTNLTLEDNIIFGFVDGETPGVMNRVIGGKTSPVVTTRITWRGESRQVYG